MKHLMERMMDKVWRFLEDDEGPTAVEYAILLALIILVCFVAIGNVGTKTNTLMNRVSEQGGFGN